MTACTQPRPRHVRGMNPTPASDETFDELVADSNCLVAFSGLYDLRFDALYAASAAAHPGVPHLTVRTSASPELVHRFDVDETPAVLVVLGGTPLTGIAGEITAADLAALCDALSA